MFRYILGGGDLRSYLISFLISLPIILLSLSLHEAAHGFTAWRLGDPTARNMGRLTLNPLKHLDPIGVVCMLLAGIGFAKPVPVNSRYFKHYRRDVILVNAAGPASNLCLSLFFLLLLRFVGYGWLARIPVPYDSLRYFLIYFTLVFLYYGVYLNVSLAVFNLLPLPPLDGSNILFTLLPPRIYFKVMRYQRVITLAVMLLFFIGPLSELFHLLVGLIVKGMFAAVGMSGFLI